MKIILTGADGQLGTELQSALAGHEVDPVDVEELDITSFDDVIAHVRRVRPELIINAAAYTDVDGSEQNPDLAYKINAVGTQNLAIAAEAAGAAILHVSTDFVFDGAKDEPYLELDPANPLSVYGRSKLAGEIYVQTLTNRHYICRTAWLYGANGHNFVKTMLQLAREGRPVKVVDDQIGSPTNAADLAHKLVEIGTSGRFGVYHTTNSGQTTWFGFAEKIFELANLKVDLSPIKTPDMPRPARRPGFSVLRGAALELQGMPPMRGWEEALADYFKNNGSG